MKKLFIILTLTIAAATGWAGVVTFEFDDFKFSLNTSSNRLTCTGLSAAGEAKNLTTIAVPSMISYNGTRYFVREIGDNAFAGNTHVTSAAVYSSVKKLGSGAFKNCTALTEVSLECDTVGLYAFEGCSSLSTITLEGVNLINSRAFAGTAISSLTLPSTISSGGFMLDACDDCPNFTEFKVDDGNQLYSAVDGLLMNKSQTTLIRIPVAKPVGKWFLKLPLSCTRIGGSACANNGFNEPDFCIVDIPYGITSIGSFAFQNVKKISSLAIPSTVTSIGEYAFRNMTATNFKVASTTPPTLENDVFSGVNRMSLSVPVSAWVYYANAPIWKNFRYISPGAADIYSDYAGQVGGFIVTKAATASTHGEVTMVYCGQSRRATLVPETVTYRGQEYDVTALGDSCCAGSTKLTSFTLPGRITTVPRHAFENCTELTICNLTNVTSIGDSAFYLCNQLASFTFDKYLQRIGNYAFFGADLTGSLNLYHPVYSCALGNYALYNCPNLTELIVFGSTMGNNAFGGQNKKDSFRCYVAHPYVASRRNATQAWSEPSWASSRILPFFVSSRTSAILSMPDKITNAQHCVLPTAAESDGQLRFYAVTGYKSWLGGEFKTTEITAGSALRAGDAVLVTGIEPNRVYRMGVPTSTPSVISGNKLVGNPYATGTSVTLEDDSYYYYYRPDNEDFFRYYSDFNVAFGSGYLRDTGKNTQSTIVNADALCYPLQVASTRVKPSNADNITSNYIKSGTVSYNPQTNVLNLNNVRIETTSTALQANIPRLTVNLVGDNTFTQTSTSNYYTGIIFEESSDVVITGGGSLTATGGKGGYGENMFLNTHQQTDSVMFTIKNCTVNATPFSDDYEENLTVDNATLYCSGNVSFDIGRTLILKDCYLSKPAGGVFDAGCFWVNNQIYYGEIEILPSGGTRGDLNGDGNVNVGDVSALYKAILAGSTDSKYDLNGDGSVNVGDVSALYALIIG